MTKGILLAAYVSYFRN